MVEDDEVWFDCHIDDLWVFDKLILSRKLGYVCGPIDAYVPEPDHYIVRPCVNPAGMGRGATIEYIEKDTDHLPVGYLQISHTKSNQLVNGLYLFQYTLLLHLYPSQLDSHKDEQYNGLVQVRMHLWGHKRILIFY
jgi:hypothetical protein